MNQTSIKDRLTNKIVLDENDKIETVVNNALEWLDDKKNGEKKDCEEKSVLVEIVCTSGQTSFSHSFIDVDLVHKLSIAPTQSSI